MSQLLRQKVAAPARDMILRLVGTLLAVVAWSSSGFGQTPPPIQTVRFTVFSPKPISDLAYVPKPNSAPLKVQFYPTARSPRYEYRGSMPLRFIDATSGTVIAEAVIPPTVRDALLLFTPVDGNPAAAGTLRYRVSILDDGAARQGAGGLAIINFSGLSLSGTVGKESITLKPGLNPTLSVNKSAKVTLSTTFKGRTFQSHFSTVTLAPKQRALLLLFPPFNPGSLEVQSRLLLDQPPATPPAAR